jgi:hypothetical protein
MLPGHEYETACDKANDEGAEWTCASLKRIDPRSSAHEKRHRMDGKREQRPAEYPESDDEKNADDDHGDGSRDKVARVAPSTTTMAPYQE